MRGRERGEKEGDGLSECERDRARKTEKERGVNDCVGRWVRGSLIGVIKQRKISGCYSLHHPFTTGDMNTLQTAVGVIVYIIHSQPR